MGPFLMILRQGYLKFKPFKKVLEGNFAKINTKWYFRGTNQKDLIL